jgi:hypothetical protein
VEDRARGHHLRNNLGLKGSTLSEWAAFQLDGEEAIEGLSKIRHVVFVGNGMTVVDLSAPPGAG